MNLEADGDTSVQPINPDRIGDSDFRNLVAKRACTLLGLANHLSSQRSNSLVLTRPLLGDLLSQSTQLEELLDAYGARNNHHWCRFRSLTAALKLFADVGYKLLHIRHVSPGYRLLPVEQNFVTATAQALEFTRDVLVRAAASMLNQAVRLSLPIPAGKLRDEDYAEQLPPGRLPRDRATRKIESAAETVTHLATAFLNLAAESGLLHTAARISPAEYASCFPDPVSEDSLRYLKFRFHTLQSLYDTYVSETEIESLDADLPILRGHISIVFHLLETATQFAHYYERHLNAETGDPSLRRKPILTCEALLATLMNYSITFASIYLACGQRLCHTMLKRYAEVGKVEAPVPRYRGFHVRPATLVARIVLHYGSDVRMELDDTAYDASSPMDIFRANEKINAQKRRWLISEITRLPLSQGDPDDVQIRAAVMSVIFNLAEQGKLIVYQQPLQLAEEFPREGIPLEKVTNEIARLLATGQIDIKTDLNVIFSGDKRVLADIKLLAESGYGEDNFGNNIALPKELAYLRR